MKKITDEWLNSAGSDLQLIQEIIEVESLTHLAAFHAQQVIEKSFKAIIEEFDLGFIKTHSLETLYNKVKEIMPVLFDYELLILLDQLYIDSRYPGQMGLLPNGKPNLQEAMDFFHLAESMLGGAKTVCDRL
jgi:HEPN domain-containing protein